MHTKIPVWRSFYVPSNISLCRLHIAIQMVMGWRNSHMHEFKFGKLIFLPNSIEGFEHFCKVINNPKNKEYSKMHKWVYDFQAYPNDMKWPDGFEIDKVNEILKSEFRLKRK